MSKNTIFNNKYIGWILFIMLIAGYSAYWVDNNRDFNTVIFDENNKVRDIGYIATEYHKLFKDTDLEHMPEFKPFSDEDQSLLPESLSILYSSMTNDIPFLVTVQSIENTIILGYSISYLIDSTNSIEDMATNLKAGFEILEKAYPKDKKSLDKIYSEIPMHFTKYTNQENYKEKEYKDTYHSILEEENIDVKYINIYILNSEYMISITKFIAKKEK